MCLGVGGPAAEGADGFTTGGWLELLDELADGGKVLKLVAPGWRGDVIEGDGTLGLLGELLQGGRALELLGELLDGA